jgi:hypothetical protein
MGVNKTFGGKERVAIFEKVWKQLTRGESQRFTAIPKMRYMRGAQIFLISRSHLKILGDMKQPPY